MCTVRDDEKAQRDRAEAMKAQQRYGDYAWGLPDTEAEPDKNEVEQEQAAVQESAEAV